MILNDCNQYNVYDQTNDCDCNSSNMSIRFHSLSTTTTTNRVLSLLLLPLRLRQWRRLEKWPSANKGEYFCCFCRHHRLFCAALLASLLVTLLRRRCSLLKPCFSCWSYAVCLFSSLLALHHFYCRRSHRKTARAIIPRKQSWVFHFETIFHDTEVSSILESLFVM